MLDFCIYLKNIDAFSPQAFEAYCLSLGFDIKLHPAFDLVKNVGFLPMRLIDVRFAIYQNGGSFLTGFEVYSEPSEHTVSAPPQKVSLFKKLFSKKQPKETPFDQAVKDCTYLVSLRCGVADSFEILMAFIFGGYLIKTYGGIFDDPQCDYYYDDSQQLELAANEFLAHLIEKSEKGELQTHPFQGWEATEA